MPVGLLAVGFAGPVPWWLAEAAYGQPGLPACPRAGRRQPRPAECSGARRIPAQNRRNTAGPVGWSPTRRDWRSSGATPAARRRRG